MKVKEYKSLKVETKDETKNGTINCTRCGREEKIKDCIAFIDLRTKKVLYCYCRDCWFNEVEAVLQEEKEMFLFDAQEEIY